MKFLSKQDLRCADGSVIRREIAKLMGVKNIDAGFTAACRNGLTGLRVRGRVTRKGTMWELTGEVPS